MQSSTPVDQTFQQTEESALTAWLIRIPVLFITGVILLVIVLFAAMMMLQSQLQDRIMPGVYVMDVSLGGLSYDEAREALAAQPNPFADLVYTFQDGDQTWQFSGEELGLAFDVDETLETAINHGRNASITDFVDQAQTWFNGTSIAPVMTYDEAAAANALQTIATEIDQPVINDSLRIENGEVITTSGQTGRTLNVAATLSQLNDAIMSGQPGQIGLVIDRTEPVIASAEEAAERVRVALSAPVHLVASDADGNQLGPWTASVDQIASLLQIELVPTVGDTQIYDVSVDASAFADYLETLAPGLIQPAVSGRFDFDETTGQLTPIVRSTSGRELNIPETITRLEEAIFSSDARIVPMAFDFVLPDYHDRVSAAELGITELVAEATTYFTGSTQNRRRNIAVSASKFDGVIIPPDGEFSFNTILGDISEENGFVEGKVIFGGRTVDGIGGGVCQVSTTVFRAAFSGGFAITERNSHGYRVGYYELNGSAPGLDAAIWQPERDFRFQNNTPYHLLIETSVYPETNALQFRFYSTKHWDAEIEPAIVKNLVPALPDAFEANSDLNPGEIIQVDYAAEGADVTVYRNIYDASGEFVREDYVYTHYLPWQAIYQVAPGDQRLSNN